MERRTSGGGLVILGAAWALIGFAFFVQLFTGVRTWDECVGGNDSGLIFAVLGLVGGLFALVLAQGVLLWRGGIAGSRWLAVALGVLTAAALAGTWALVAHHPFYDCPPGG